ncbi:MAG: hypothetical protein ABIK31_05420 [candidate division WOR-3 bacterium]
MENSNSRIEKIDSIDILFKLVEKEKYFNNICKLILEKDLWIQFFYFYTHPTISSVFYTYMYNFSVYVTACFKYLLDDISDLSVEDIKKNELGLIFYNHGVSFDSFFEFYTKFYIFYKSHSHIYSNDLSKWLDSDNRLYLLVLN